PALSLDWQILRASIRYARPLPERLSIDGREIVASSETSGKRLFTAAGAQFHMRPNGADVDLAGSVNGLKIAGERFEGRSLLPIEANLDLAVEDGVAWISELQASLRGRRGTIRQARIAAGADGA